MTNLVVHACHASCDADMCILTITITCEPYVYIPLKVKAKNSAGLSPSWSNMVMLSSKTLYILCSNHSNTVDYDTAYDDHHYLFMQIPPLVHAMTDVVTISKLLH